MAYSQRRVKKGEEECKNGLTCEYHDLGSCAHYHDDKPETECLWGPHCTWKSTCGYNHDGRYIDKPKLHPNQCKYRANECKLNCEGRCLKYHKNQSQIRCYYKGYCRYMDVVTKTGYICPYYHEESWKIFRKESEKILNPNYVDSDDEKFNNNIQQCSQYQNYQTAPFPVSTKPAVNYTPVPAKQVYQHVNQSIQYNVYNGCIAFKIPVQCRGPNGKVSQTELIRRIPIQHNTVQYPPIQYPAVQYPAVQHAPVQYPAIQHNTVKHAPVQYAPAQRIPIQHNTVQYPAMQYAPFQHPSMQYAPVQHVPIQHPLIQHNPVQHFPVQHTHVQHFPVNTPIQYNTFQQKSIEYAAKQDYTKRYNTNQNDDQNKVGISAQPIWTSRHYNDVMTAVERENAKVYNF